MVFSKTVSLDQRMLYPSQFVHGGGTMEGLKGSRARVKGTLRCTLPSTSASQDNQLNSHTNILKAVKTMVYTIAMVVGVDKVRPVFAWDKFELACLPGYIATRWLHTR